MEKARAGGSNQPLRVMMLGYGVGLSWGSILTQIDRAVVISHADYRLESTLST